MACSFARSTLCGWMSGADGRMSPAVVYELMKRPSAGQRTCWGTDDQPPVKVLDPELEPHAHRQVSGRTSATIGIRERRLRLQRRNHKRDGAGDVPEGLCRRACRARRVQRLRQDLLRDRRARSWKRALALRTRGRKVSTKRGRTFSGSGAFRPLAFFGRLYASSTTAEKTFLRPKARRRRCARRGSLADSERSPTSG